MCKCSFVVANLQICVSRFQISHTYIRIKENQKMRGITNSGTAKKKTKKKLFVILLAFYTDQTNSVWMTHVHCNF